MFQLEDVKNKRTPDFENLLTVLRREQPPRYTLFEFFLNDPLEAYVTGAKLDPNDPEDVFKNKIEAFAMLGYDYTTMHASDFVFPHKQNEHGKASISVNEGAIITDPESYKAYQWPDPEAAYNGRLERLAPYLPEGMKFVVYGPSGVLENVMALTGYDNLCYMLADEPELVEEIFYMVGSRLIKYYKQIVEIDCVGALISNDDWGFNTQTMLSTADMRRLVFPYHKQMVELAHSAGKPIFLHSCGNLERVMDDVIDSMGYDGKHSYEDKIMPVEEAYDRYGGRIAIMGGIDMDYVCRADPKDVYNRSLAMLEKTGGKGYALGTGNSIPEYVPYEGYFAMIAAALNNEIK